MFPKKLFDAKIVFPLFAFCIPFTIYCFSQARTYLPPDGAEFALCIQYVGICHPPGFFLYILLGKLFTLLFPFGSLIYKTNLLSAVYAAGTILCIYLTMLKLHVSRNIAFLTSLLFAVTSSFWYFSLSADVFTFATLLLSLTLFLLFNNKAYLSFLFLGLLTAHFPNSIILLPIFIWYFKKYQHNNIKILLKYSLIFCAGFFPFIILLFLRMLQDPVINWGHITTMPQFVDYVERKEFGGLFLIKNPVFVFTLSNVFSQTYLFLLALLTQFGLIVSFIAGFTLIKEKLFKNDKVLFLILIFISLAGINLFSLTSIDPFANGVFQFDKFYLSSFTVMTILIGIGINKLTDLGIHEKFIVSTLTVIILLQFFVNWNTHNVSSNYFSKTMIENALNELPANAIVITLSNSNYFGSWYEQLVENKYKHMTFVYIPNNTNMDFEKYHPELLSGKPNQTITARSNQTHTNAFKFILTIAARNTSKPMYIWQGDSVDSNQVYFNGLLQPYGLWWKVDDLRGNNLQDSATNQKILSNLKNQLSNLPVLTTAQRFLELNVYTSAFLSTATELTKTGKYTDAVPLFNEVLNLDPNNSRSAFISNEITTINEIQNVAPTTQSLVSAKDETDLMQLAQDYYSLGDYDQAIEVYKKILLFDPQNAEIDSNIGAMYATVNDKRNGILYFNKALKLDPTLNLAIRGKEKLESTQ